MTRPAPVAPQLAALLSTATGAAKSAATNRAKPDQPAISKRSAQFSSLFGRLVEKKEKSSAKQAETETVPFAGSPLAPPPPPKQESQDRGPAAFGLGESGSDPITRLPNNPQPQASRDGIPPLLTAPALSAMAPTSAVATKSAPQPQPLSISRVAVSPLKVPENVPSPGVSVVREEPADSDFSVHHSSTSGQTETPALPSLVALPGNAFAPVTAASDSNPHTGSQDSPSLEGLSEFSSQPPPGSGSTRPQIGPPGLGKLTEKGAGVFSYSTEKPVPSKAKVSVGSLREHLAQMIDPGPKGVALSQTQSQAGELESGLSGGNSGEKETSAHSEQSQNANVLQANPGEAPRPGSLAFAARLVSLPETPVAAGNSGIAEHSASAGPTGQKEADASHPLNGPAAQVSKDSPKSGGTADAQPAATPSSSPSAPMPAVPQTAATQMQNNASSAAHPGNDSSSPPAAKDVHAAAPAGVQSPAQSPARDIHLQLNQGEQRVDVRLSERSGEVHVAVRTPDPQLAGALRDDLPRLSDRLEASGFRADTWHAGLQATLSGGERRLEATESSFSQPRESGQGQAGEKDPQQQQQQQPRQPKPGTAQTSNSQRKDFQWFMSQLP